MKVSNIIKGFFNLAKGEELTDTQVERAQICHRCPKMTKMNTCAICYCYLPAKIRVDHEKCPNGKW